MRACVCVCVCVCVCARVCVCVCVGGAATDTGLHVYELFTETVPVAKGCVCVGYGGYVPRAL